MEDWPAFSESFESMVGLLRELGDTANPRTPATVSLLSGDIHFSYASEIRFPDDHPIATRVHQLVSSPVRNALKPQERTVMRLGTSRFALHVGRLLRRTVRRPRAAVSWEMDLGPTFDNGLGELRFDGRSARLEVLGTKDYEADAPPELETVFEIDLVAGARSQATGIRAPRNVDG
jgi:hypothetical protein